MEVITEWPDAYYSIREHISRKGKLFFEIGTGNGEFFLWIVSSDIYLCVGSDIKKKRVNKLVRKLGKIEKAGIVILGDGKRVLRDLFPPSSIDKIVINYPDPWPGKGQSWRRVSYPYFIRLISDRLKKGGVVHMSTDYFPIFDEFSLAIRKVGIFKPLPSKPQANLFRGIFTRYETQWIEEGRSLFQWSFVKKEDYIDNSLKWIYSKYKPVRSPFFQNGFWKEIDGWIVKVVYDRDSEIRLLIIEKESKIAYNLLFKRDNGWLNLMNENEVIFSEKLQRIIEKFVGYGKGKD